VTVASRRLLILFGVALLAVGAYLAIELPRHRAELREQREAARLFAFDPAEVEAIEVAREDTRLAFRLQGTHWIMTAPLADDAEVGTVAPIVTTLADAEVVRDLGTDNARDRFGLDPPAATVRLAGAGGRAVAALEIGDYTVDRSAVYALRGDGHLLLVPTAIHRALTLAVEDYRNRRVVVFDLSVVRAFEIDSRLTGRSRWTRRGAGSWFTVIAGDTVRGDSVAVPAVLRRLRGMRVRAFVTAPDTTRPLVSVTIDKDDGSTQAVRFFDAGQYVFQARVSGNPRTVEIGEDPGDIAAQSVATLRDRRLLHFDPAQAHRITFTTPDTSAVMVRAGDAWALPNPALGTIDRERAADLVRTLRALRYEPPVGTTPADPRPHPRFSLVIQDAGDTILEELFCAPGPASRWAAYSRSLGGVCEIDGAALDAIADRLSRLRD